MNDEQYGGICEYAETCRHAAHGGMFNMMCSQDYRQCTHRLDAGLVAGNKKELAHYQTPRRESSKQRQQGGMSDRHILDTPHGVLLAGIEAGEGRR